MGSAKSTLSVLKALGARKSDKYRDILGQQQLKGRNAAGWQIRQGRGAGKKPQLFLGLSKARGPELWEMSFSAGRSLLVMLLQWGQRGFCARELQLHCWDLCLTFPRWGEELV